MKRTLLVISGFILVILGVAAAFYLGIRSFLPSSVAIGICLFYNFLLCREVVSYYYTWESS